MAAPQAQSIDDLMVCLMSMGFEWQDCQDAVQSGKVTVETAVEWLLAGKPGFRATDTATSTPSLDLRPNTSNFNEGVNPFANPISLPAAVDQSTTKDVTQNADQSKSTSDTDDNQSENILSRLHLSSEQREIKQHFEKRQRDEAKHEAMKEKQRRKRDHDRILKEIAEDREKQKQLHGSATGGSPVKSSVTPEPSTSPKDTESKPKSSTDKCLLRIRQPNGSSTNTSLSVTSCLRDVWNGLPNYNKSSYRLIQPFPHREFGDEDLDKTLEELGLTPTGSLVVQKKDKTDQVTEAAVSHQVTPSRMEEDSGTSGSPTNNSGVLTNNQLAGISSDLLGMPPNIPGLPTSFGPGSGPNFSGGPGVESDYSSDEENPMEWGPGHKLDADEDIEAMDEEVDDDMAVIGHGLPVGGAAHGGWGGGNNMDEENQSFWGIGQRLVPEGVPHHNEGQHHTRSARDLAAEKARERFSQPQDASPSQENPSTHVSLTYSVEDLMHLCMSHVSHRLNDPRHLIRSLSGISEDLAQKLLQHLLKQKLLKPKTLNAFIPCFLRKLVLDCYPYATNELLQSVRLHSHLQTLSMRSCSLITDSGMQAITGLRKVKYLNLSGCRQLTDKVLPIIQELQSLTSLNLEDTGITEDGLINYLEVCPQCLQHLNLNRTKVTERIFAHLKGLPALRSLYMDFTEMSGLSGIQDLQHLETLDVSHTDIVTDSLLCLRENTSLTCLSISHTNKVNGDRALEYLSGLKLQAINLPSRHTTTDAGMKYLSGFPLTSLDLTNFRNVGNAGMQSIGQIKTLKRLLLINTSVTDEGMFYLEGLKQLEILYLDKTNITDEGASVIKEFTHLQELSLASTRVTSKFLMEGVLCNCYYLSKLNLSYTGVTTKGVRSLALESLTLLNLESTAVKPILIELLYSNCPKLKNVIANNLIPVDAVTDDDDMDS